MVRKSLGLVVVFGVAVGVAQAGSITYQGIGLAGTADISYNGGAAEYAYAGYLNFKGGLSLGFSNDLFAAICGDVQDNISPGSSYGAVLWDSQAYATFSGR